MGNNIWRFEVGNGFSLLERVSMLGFNENVNSTRGSTKARIFFDKSINDSFKLNKLHHEDNQLLSFLITHFTNTFLQHTQPTLNTAEVFIHLILIQYRLPKFRNENGPTSHFKNITRWLSSDLYLTGLHCLGIFEWRKN
jgi:hypothetical protein